MSFPKSFLEELKARVRVSDVVGRKVKLKRHGREFMGLSPFSNEKTPSFTVNDEKQFYHCFSTGEHGDVIKFLEKTENLSFLEAVERLAAEAGLEMPQRDPRAAEREKQQTGLIDVMKMAQDYFRAGLTRGHGAEARAYLQRRGLKAETVERFGLGYAPDQRHGLLKTLQAQGVKISQMIEAGLIIGGEDIKEPYDRFRNRLMFPIEDARGRVIAFGGRALDPDARAKYLNSPETPLFHKGHVLYNYARARKAAYDAGTVIACEGYMDVIALAQAGFEHAVAPLGTAMTENQIDLLWRLAPEPILCFDGDKAGVKAAFRAMERVLPLLKPGHSVRVALLPDGNDPDDIIRGGGAEQMSDLLQAAVPLSDLVGSWVVQGEKLKTPDDRVRLETKLESILETIADDRIKRHYKRTLRDKLWQHFADVFGWNVRQKIGQEKRKPPQLDIVGKQARLKIPDPFERTEIDLVAHVLNHPRIASEYFEALERVVFRTAGLRNLVNEIVRASVISEITDPDTLLRTLRGRGLDGIINRIRSSVVAQLRAGRDKAFEEAEESFLATLQLLIAWGQFYEINEEALQLTDSEVQLKDFCNRVNWLAAELRNNSLSGYDGHFFLIGAEYRKLRLIGGQAPPI